jgi:hypothetical protein
MLGSDELRAWYGPDHVALAVSRGAVGTLLISDELFRCVSPPFFSLLFLPSPPSLIFGRLIYFFPV